MQGVGALTDDISRRIVCLSYLYPVDEQHRVLASCANINDRLRFINLDSLERFIKNTWIECVPVSALT